MRFQLGPVRTNGVLVGVDETLHVVICKDDASLAVITTLTNLDHWRETIETAELYARIYREEAEA